MKLLREIIELASDNQMPLTGVLRKCLVLAYSLKNERLKNWVDKELNGYQLDDELPVYRVAYPVSKGHLFGRSGGRVENLPLTTLVLKEEHRDIVEKVELREPIATYLPTFGQERSTKKWVTPWPTNLIAMYQNYFSKGYVLVEAWNELPPSFMDALVDTVRTRLLQFALELDSEFGASSEDTTALPRESVEKTVINIYNLRRQQRYCR